MRTEIKAKRQNLAEYDDTLTMNRNTDVWLTVHRNSEWIRKTN